MVPLADKPRFEARGFWFWAAHFFWEGGGGVVGCGGRTRGRMGGAVSGPRDSPSVGARRGGHGKRGWVLLKPLECLVKGVEEGSSACGQSRFQVEDVKWLRFPRGRFGKDSVESGEDKGAHKATSVSLVHR